MEQNTPKLRVGGRTCQCSGCGQFFGGVAAFDKHLIHQRGEAPPVCLSPRQMKKVGLHKTARGVWSREYRGPDPK